MNWEDSEFSQRYFSEREGEFIERARADIGLCMRNFSELEDEGASILPVELWVEIKQLSTHMNTILIEFDEGNYISEEQNREFCCEIYQNSSLIQINYWS